jgi:Trk K+ transport system NAD-binding subunit
MIQSLALTLRIKRDDIAVLDAMRRKRNLNDYSGDPIDAETLREAVSRAEALIRLTVR